VDGTAQIARMREQGWLFDHQLRHEVYRIIEVALPSAASGIADALVVDVITGPVGASADADDRAYEQFNTLVWIIEYAPDLARPRECSWKHS
jgi:hypothetical protein